MPQLVINSIFRKWALLSLIGVALLILVGGSVRITGSGMGCPDWPRCYGKLVPPFSVADLPTNYRSIYATENGPADEFNPLYTWVEYINRLVSVVLGFILIVLLVLALMRIRIDALSAVLSIVVVVLTGYAAWLGAKVVESELNSSKVTQHLTVALLILFSTAIIYLRSSGFTVRTLDSLSHIVVYTLLAASIVTGTLLYFQVVTGTGVRAEVDNVRDSLGGQRSEWLTYASNLPLHRYLSIATALGTAALYSVARLKLKGITFLSASIRSFTILVVLQIITGLFLNHVGFPAIAQFLHLALFTLMFISLSFVFAISATASLSHSFHNRTAAAR